MSPKGRDFLICVSVSCEEELSGIEAADIAEVRLDVYSGSESPLKTLSIPLILTNRRKDEGGSFEGSEEERVALLLDAALSLKPSYIDIEWRTPYELKEKLRRTGIPLILSFHNLNGTPDPEDMLDTLNRMLDFGAYAYKIVTTARSPEDSLKVLSFLVKARGRARLISHAMGGLGRLSRVLSPLFGSIIVYVSPRGGKGTAEGQLSIEEFLELYSVMKGLIYG